MVYSNRKQIKNYDHMCAYATSFIKIIIPSIIYIDVHSMLNKLVNHALVCPGTSVFTDWFMKSQLVVCSQTYHNLTNYYKNQWNLIVKEKVHSIETKLNVLEVLARMGHLKS